MSRSPLLRSAVASLATAIVALPVAPAVGQDLHTYPLSEIEAPCEGVAPILAHGPDGMLWAGCPDGDSLALRFHDGTRWSRALELAGGDRLVSEAGGALVVQRGPRLFTYGVPRSSALERPVATVGEGRDIDLAILVGGGGDVYVQSGDAVGVARGGGAVDWFAGAGQLVGYDPARGLALVLEADGGVRRFPGGGREAVYRLAPGTRASSVALRPDGASGFVARDTTYLPTARGYRALANPYREGRLLLRGGHALLVAGKRKVHVTTLGADAGWRPLPREAAPGARARGYFAQDARAAVGCNGRVALATVDGLIAVERTAIRRLDLGFAPEGGRAAIARGGPDVVAGRPKDVTRFGPGATTGDTLRATFDAGANLMRFSAPTEIIADASDTLRVATSDGRVVRVLPGRPASVEVDLRGSGGYIFDLHRVGEDLWGAFDPAPFDNAGLFRAGPDGRLEVFGEGSGLDGRVLSVRSSPSGTLFASMGGGDAPVARFLEEQRFWMGIPAPPGMRIGQVHEVAALSDTLLYLATASGLWRYAESEGYGQVALPHRLSRRECTSVVPYEGGVWFVLAGSGAYYLRDGVLLAVDAPGHWGRREFGFRGLRVLEGGRVLLADRHEVFELMTMSSERATLPRLRFARTADHSLAQWSSTLPVHLHDGDSLYVEYALPGFSARGVSALFMLDGEVLAPTREDVGLAVFAPLPTGESELKVALTPRHLSGGGAAATQRLRVVGPWYASRGGVIVLAVLSLSLLGLVGYAKHVQQVRLARRLEALVVERTAALERAHGLAERASQAKSIFLASMSHEIRTPLNAVVGMATILRESELDEEQRGAVEAVLRGGERLEAIVDDVMAFNEVDTGRVRRRERDVDLLALVHGVLEAHATAADERGLFIGYDTADLPRAARADEPKVRAVLSHLLDNAIKFTDRGSVFLRAGVEADDEGAAWLRIEIRDTGIGIAAANLERIFEVFEQADNSSTRRYGGAGLGLAIVRTYVGCLGGEIALEAAVGGGTVARVGIPIAVPAAPAPGAAAAVAPSARVRAVVVGGRSEYVDQLVRDFACVGVEVGPLADRPAGWAEAALVVVDGTVPVAALRGLPTVRELLAGDGAVAFVGPSRHLNRARLSEGELTLGYPFAPGEIERLVAAWRRPRRATTPSAPGDAAARSRVASGLLSPPTAPNPRGVPLGAPVVAEPPGGRPAGPPTFFDLAGECPLRILVAEDNTINKLLALKVLGKLGYEADWAPDGRVAVERHGERPYDLIFMDVHMPELDGLGATRAIRARDGGDAVYVCALTANATEEGRDECLEAGMNGFMSKPLKVGAMVEVIRLAAARAARPAREELA